MRDGELTAEIAIGRPGDGEVVEIVMRVPDGAGGCRRIRVTMAAASFALALTGRGGVTGWLREVTFKKGIPTA